MDKKIAYIYPATEKEIGDGFKVKQPFPNKEFRFANPFILLHHMGPEEIHPYEKMRIHPHPHRGFAPITIQLQGEGYHKDNAGNAGLIKAGDVQWMFAGSGILHSEGPSENMTLHGGVFELIQLWLNVPHTAKGEPPFYQYIYDSDMPELSAEEGISLKLICGEYENITTPVKSFSPVTIIKGVLSTNKSLSIKAISGYWTLLYIVKGSIEIESKTVTQNNVIIFFKMGEQISITSKEESILLFLSAEPIDEPVAAKDNFVLNTMDEVDQAMADFRNGLFGNLDF